MPTVPNWIGHAVVILPSRGTSHSERAFAVIHWRATKTQVIVQIDDSARTEVRFHLEEGLRGIGYHRQAELLDAEDPVTVKRILLSRYLGAVREFEIAIHTIRVDRIRSDPEALAVEIGKVRDAATQALAALAEVL